MYNFYSKNRVQPPGCFRKLLLIMKLTSLILITVILHVSASSLAQKVTLSAKKQPLSKVFEQIGSQTGYDFAYTTRALRDANPVNIEVVSRELPEVLKMIFADQPLNYSVEDKTVIINEKEKSFIGKLKAQIRPVQSSAIIDVKVTDERGNPLPGVSIRVKNTKFSFTTNEKGEFKAAIIIQDAVLQFTIVGYITREIPLNQLKNGAVIVLKEDIGKLDELQVVAYGTTTKRLSTGDQTTVTAADIAKYPTTNVLDVLQGSVPGLMIYKNTGNPNSTYKVQMRGINGITSGSPLYIVDGIPYQGGAYTSRNSTLGANTLGGTAGQGGDALSLINPQDIESVTVLKDASATAIYGTRAADGVIIITTKKGKPGSPKVDVNFYQGYTTVNHLPDMLNLQQYLEMRREAKKNDNAAISPTDYDINGAWDNTRSTDWNKTLLGNTGHVTNAQVGISGGSNNTQYRIGTGYSRQTNVTDLSGSSQNANLSFSINTKTDDNKFSVDLSGGYLYNVNTTTPSDFTASLTLAPDAPALYNPDGSLNSQNNTFTNPLLDRNLLNSATSGNLTSSTRISYRPVEGLEFKVTLGYNKQLVNEFMGRPTTALPPFAANAQPVSTFSNSSNSSWSIEPQVNYNKDISKGRLSVIIGSSLQKSINESSVLQASGYSSDLLLRSITAGTTITSAVPYSYSPYKLNSLFGRVSYNWDKKYLLDVSGRDDGSSHFGENRQFHLFGAVGAAWIFSEESLIKNNLGFLSFGKLRGSYGVTGRDNTAAYQYLSTYSANGQTYQGVGSLVPLTLPNADLSWESTKKAEVSLELHFFKERLSFETNFYRNRTSDVLSANPLSLVTGFQSIVQNLPAVIQNQGFDMSLTSYNIRKNDFSWSTTVLFTRDRNSLLSYPGLAQSGYASRYVIGQSVNTTHLFSFAGVNPQTGVYQFNSKSGAIVSAPVTGTDDFKLVNTNPDFYGSVQNSFRYKQFTLDFLLRFVKQTGKSAFGLQSLYVPGLFANTNVNTMFLNRWQKPGDITDIQRYGTSFSLLSSQISATNSDHAYGDASYVRFQNLSFAYTITQALQKKLHVQNLQVYIQGENLLTISKYGAFDPESQSLLSLPPLRTITAGLRLSL